MPFFDRLIRPYERDGVAGYVLYMIGISGVAVIISPTAAIPSIWALTIGDPVSGVLSENTSNEWKGPIPLAAMFLVTVALTVPITSETTGTTVGAVAAITGALLGVIADGAPPALRDITVDDNLTIPVAVASGIEMVLWVAG